MAVAGFSHFAARPLVFVEERERLSHLHAMTTRLRARAPKAERAYYGEVLRNRGNNETL